MYEDDADMHAMWSEATEHTRAYDDAAVLRMLAEVAELRKDRARLDWIEGDRRRNIEFHPNAGIHGSWLVCRGSIVIGRSPEGVRAAIDAAISAE